jgi:hypothetical protein
VALRVCCDLCTSVGWRSLGCGSFAHWNVCASVGWRSLGCGSLALSDDDPILKLVCLLVKSTDMAMMDTIESTDATFRASEVTNSRSIQLMRGKEIISLQDHRVTTSKVKAELKKQKVEKHQNALMKLLAQMPTELSRIINRGCEIGAWLTVMPSTLVGTVLSSDDFCDSLHIQYGHIRRDYSQSGMDVEHIFIPAILYHVIRVLS